MLPKKLIIFGLLVIAGVGYLLKNKSVNMLQPKDLQKELELKAKKRALKKQGISDTSNMDLDKVDVNGEPKAPAEDDPRKLGNKFIVGQCLTNRDDGWEFTKILGVGPRVYKIIDCHKYKGCSMPSEVSWAQIEFEYRSGKIIECSR